MSRYRRIDTRFWNDEKVARLTPLGKLAFLFILTHPNMTAVGAMRGTLAGLAEELKIGVKPFREPFQERFLAHDPDTHFIWARNFLKYNEPHNPNQVKSLLESVDLIPECRLKTQLLQELKRLLERLGKPFLEPFTKRFGAGALIQDQDQDHDQDPLSPSSLSSTLPGTVPRTRPKPGQGKTAFPPDLTVTDEEKASWLKFGINASIEFARFRDHALANDRRCKDWDAAKRNWFRKAVDLKEATHVSPLRK